MKKCFDGSSCKKTSDGLELIKEKEITADVEHEIYLIMGTDCICTENTEFHDIELLDFSYCSQGVITSWIADEDGYIIDPYDMPIGTRAICTYAKKRWKIIYP